MLNLSKVVSAVMGCQFAVMSFPWGKNAKLIYLQWAQKMAAVNGMVSVGICVFVFVFVDLSQKKILLTTSCSQAILPWVHLKVTNMFCGHITSYYLTH
jgi:hypothetical protein